MIMKHTMLNLFLALSSLFFGACADDDLKRYGVVEDQTPLAQTSVYPSANGNVLLRRAQYRVADDPAQSCVIARSMVFGKVHNARWSIERTRRDHGLRVDNEVLAAVSAQLKDLLPQIAAGLPAVRFAALRGFAEQAGAHSALLIDPWAGGGDFDEKAGE